MDAASVDQRDAFLLGNQGPDPLFFLVMSPSKHAWRKLGSRMHRENTTKLLHALGQALSVLDENERAIGRAYAWGFLGHYVLDSSVHPLVYELQFSLCDAGIEGLAHNRECDVHAEIERELDELMLSRKRGQTIAQYAPAANTLDVGASVLATVQKIYAYLALSVYGEQIPRDLFPASVGLYRTALRIMHSPYGIKRLLLIAGEQSVHASSRIGAMAHKAHLVEDSWFANSSHDPWTNPFTGEVRTDSFWDIYDTALKDLEDAIALFEKKTFSLDDARAITHELNFKGEPTEPVLIVHEQTIGS